jgi:hypothetical protein
MPLNPNFQFLEIKACIEFFLIIDWRTKNSARQTLKPFAALSSFTLQNQKSFRLDFSMNQYSAGIKFQFKISPKISFLKNLTNFFLL